MTTAWLTEPEQRAWRAYLESSKVLMDALDRQLQRDNDLPHAYYEILVRLSEAPERALRMSELAEVTLSSRSRLSHAAARLEERGWVRREDCPTDRRGQIATLTDEGFAVLVAAAPGHVASVRSYVIDALTEEQLAALATIGETIIARVTERT
ncbi:MarR family winged helix-turn-helix transcriptional regulator [uncultured Jatrophihabitans sp.]|uniref:MarR family winged helix-turn-helix transcriptional regulator n=1 Tax=uncultured Jatrophihabitans sp. TaxID=1610747 RepID=UPI0035CC3067